MRLPESLRRWAGMDFVWLAAALLAGAGLYFSGSLSAETAFHLPAPVVDQAVEGAAPALAGAAAAGAQLPQEYRTAVFAGGCFWGVQGVFQHTAGVIQAVSGYAGGEPQSASYDKVTTGRTGHAESVQVTFDSALVSYGQLLHVFFSVIHDPTQLNRQGPDVGSHYRSAIFHADEGQKRVADQYIAQLEAAKAFRARIVTEVTPLQGFFRAEDYHQDYATLYPNSGYIIAFDLPKIANLKSMFPALYRAEPRLVKQGGESLVRR